MSYLGVHGLSERVILATREVHVGLRVTGSRRFDVTLVGVVTC